MSFSDAVQTCFAKYLDFSGRAMRREYWFWVLFYALATFAISIVESILPTRGWLGNLFSLGVFLPWIAVTVRRLHDVGRSGWFLFLLYVPTVAGTASLGLALKLLAAEVQTGLFPSSSFSGVTLILLLAGIVLNIIGFVLWVHFLTKPGDPGANAYGPPPGTVARPPASSAPAT